MAGAAGPLSSVAALAAVPDAVFYLHTDDEGHTAELLRAGTVMAAVTTERTAV